MPSLNERIITELQRIEDINLSRLISYMKGEKGFFWVRSREHDHWTNGTAQHSWRVYQYMRYMWEHPEIDSDLDPEEVKKLSEREIILTSLLHDVGKMWGCEHHATNSKKILDEYLGKGFAQRNPKIVAAIFFHHNKSKDGGFLNDYRHSALKKLLNKADSKASGTTWHSTRFKEQRSQHDGKHSDVRHMRRVAMDRTLQVLDYKMFLDYQYDFHTIKDYNRKSIEWNSYEDLIQQIKAGNASTLSVPNGVDCITAAHQWVQKGNQKICLVIGIDLTVIKPETRYLRQDNPAEEELLICSNLLKSLYQSKNIGDFRFAYTMRDEIKQQYDQQSPDKGIFLPQVTFFRDGVSEGFRMVTPWTCDVLLVPCSMPLILITPPSVIVIGDR